MKFLPLVIVHMYPGLYQKAMESISNMSKANYFYITSYPAYNGFRIEHDPVFTAFMASAQATAATPTTNSQQPNQPRTILLIAIAIAIILAVAVIALIMRNKQKRISNNNKKP